MLEFRRSQKNWTSFYALDPTITPKMDGDISILNLRIPGSELRQVFRNESLIGNVQEFCAPPQPASEDELESFPFFAVSSGRTVHVALHVSQPRASCTTAYMRAG